MQPADTGAYKKNRLTAKGALGMRPGPRPAKRAPELGYLGLRDAAADQDVPLRAARALLRDRLALLARELGGVALRDGRRRRRRLRLCRLRHCSPYRRTHATTLAATSSGGYRYSHEHHASVHGMKRVAAR